MSASICPSKSYAFCSALPPLSGRHLSIRWGRLGSCNLMSVPGKVWGLKGSLRSRPELGLKVLQQGKYNKMVMISSATLNPVAELEKELEAEMMNLQEDGENDELQGMTKFRSKCEGNKGPLELLECLEREAIMGEDVGREPMDYSRRALIFDKSSKVFRALKECSTSTDSA